jgi:phosphatidylserine/phosphatidylglycerophosphate/cardiolipin synthase-like enzyme
VNVCRPRVATVLVVGLLTGLMSATAPSEARTASVAPATATAPSQAPAKPRIYTPHPGVLFNNPLRNDRSHVINRHVRLSMERAPKGSRIRAITWNLKSELYTRALIAAHKRGVSVRIIMSDGLAGGQSSSGSYAQLKRALATRNAHRKKSMTSWIRTCQGSCRGKTGIVHSKFFLFSEVGRARNIVMSASANLTEVAANRQWNDLTTLVNDKEAYKNFLQVFNQASLDRFVRPTFRAFREENLRGWFYPRLGRSDQILDLLDPVVCRGAAKGVGIGGKTQIRIAQAVFNGKRGLAIAKRLRELWNRGCNIRIVFTVMANQSRDVLGPIPKSHIVQDFDGDGLYDRYLHMKAIAISGHYGDKSDGRIVLNGSANWSGMSLKSDEQGLIMTTPTIVKQYNRWINYLWANPPPRSKTTPTPEARRAVADPYANVELD